MARNVYSGSKRRRELDKKKKRAEKLARKQGPRMIRPISNIFIPVEFRRNCSPTHRTTNLTTLKRTTTIPTSVRAIE